MTAKVVRNVDYHTIASWYTLRGLDAPPKGAYPTLGYKVSDIAVGFMYRVEEKLCIIEGYATNPRYSGFDRNQALNTVTKALLDYASKNKFKSVMILTEDESIVKRAEAWGFKNKASKLMLSRRLY